MPNTQRSEADLLILFADNITNDISEQDERDFIVSKQAKINGLYVIDNLNFPQSRAGIQEAVDEATTSGGVALIPPGVSITSDGTPVQMKNNVTVMGCGPTSIIKAPANSTSVDLFEFSGAQTSERPLSGNEDEGDRTITLTAGSVAALSLSVGDYIYVYSSVANHNLVTRVNAIAGEVLSLADQLPAAFTSASTGVARFSAPITRAAIKNLKLDGNGNSGTTRGIDMHYSTFCDFENLWFHDFPEAGFLTNETYGLTFRNIEITDCGSAGESDFHHRYSTNFSVHNLKSYRSGFGPQIQSCCYGRLSDIFSTSSSARAFKLQACIGNVFNNVHTLNSADTYTGFSITQVSHRNQVYGLWSESNGHAGLWIEGDCNNNRIIGGQSRFNTTRDVEVGTGATSNVFLYVDYSTILNQGTGTVLVP